MKQRNKKILLFARDPGGANTIFPLVKPLKQKGYQVLVYGKDYALKKFSQNKIKAKKIDATLKKIRPDTINQFLQKTNPDFIITGTSAIDMTEKYLWQESEKLGIPSFAILDQWMNYGIRFSKYGANNIKKYLLDKKHQYLPTRILVMDKTAKKEMIEIGIPKDKIIISGQPYFEHLRNKNISPKTLKLIKNTMNIQKDDYIVTFASEPLLLTFNNKLTDKPHLGYNEISIFKELYSVLSKVALKTTKNIKLIIKIHPRENTKYYLKTMAEIEKSKIKIFFDLNNDSQELIQISNIVCGMSSMFLIESILLDKPTISIQIGLKGINPLILCQMNLMKSCLTTDDLENNIENIVFHNQKHTKINLKLIRKPINKVIKYVEEYLCQN